MSDAVLVEALNIAKTFNTGAAPVHAVKDVSLQLREGELTLLVGPSGSGKTTLLSIIGGLLTATHGELVLGGQRIAGRSQSEMAALRLTHIGFVFQAYNLFPSLTAEENLLLALDIRGVRGANASARAAVCLADVGLTSKRHSFPAELSGGEKQRVAIARAVCGNPSVILADEPTAALDWDNGARIMALLRDLAHAQRRTILAVTHDARTLPFATRVVRIEDGSIKSEDIVPSFGVAASV